VAIAGSFARRLLAWFEAAARDLPWRRGRTSYSVVVSELMLQQTTVATVIPYFERFMARFPDWNALAAAPQEDVLAAWSGLGYYRRARSLHALAREVVSRPDREFPRTLDEALEMPGVGPYTAGAVLSMAHGLPAAAVDGNVARVLARHAGRPLVATRAADRRELEQLVRREQPRHAAGAFNEALMELGAVTCTPRDPACSRCPVARDCRARVDGTQADLPPRARRVATRAVRSVALVARRSGRVLLRQRSPEETLLPSMWELPTRDVAAKRSTRDALRSLLEEVGGGEPLGSVGFVHHVITTRRLKTDLVACTLTPSRRLPDSCRLVTHEEAQALPLTGMTRKALARAFDAAVK